jgi:hypothetical protein
MVSPLHHHHLRYTDKRLPQTEFITEIFEDNFEKSTLCPDPSTKILLSLRMQHYMRIINLDIKSYFLK